MQIADILPLAQLAYAQGDVGGTDIWSIIAAAVSLVAVAILWGVARLSGWLKGRTQNDLLRRVISGFENMVTSVVREFEQVITNKIKAGKDPNSPGGTKLTPEEQKDILNAAVDKVCELFTIPGLMKIAAAFGASATNEKQVRAFVATKVEAEVNRQKVEAQQLSKAA